MNNDKQSEPAACPKCGSEIQGTCDHKWHYDRVAPERMAQASGPTAEEIAADIINFVYANYSDSDSAEEKGAVIKRVAASLRDYAARQSERVRQLEHELTSRKATQAKLHRKHNELQRKLELASGYVANREQNEQAEREINGPSPAEHRLQEMVQALHNVLGTVAADITLPMTARRTKALLLLRGLASEQAKAKATSPDTPSAGQPE